jgi:hypothetical protein
MNAIEDDILTELRERDMQVVELRAQLYRRGHRIKAETIYERLVHLEATDQARVLVLGNKQPVRMWEAM